MNIWLKTATALLLFGFFSGALSNEFTIKIEVANEKDSSVDITAGTNIPGVIEVIGDIRIENKSENDVYIGESRNFIITDGAGKVTIDTSNLPSGTYIAEVSLYHRWGLKDKTSKATGINFTIEASKKITIKGSGEPSESAKTRVEGQRWVSLNIVSGTSWSKGDWDTRFGKGEKIPTKTRNPNIIKNYYFKSINMTIVVNTLKKEIVTWTKGKGGL